MNAKLLLCLALVAFNLSSYARFVQLWSDAELTAKSDLVVVGRPIQVKDLDETNSLGFSSTKLFQSRFRGVETTFKVSEILKGTLAGDQVVLHHYRFETGWGSPPNGPNLMEFIRGDTNEYLLYLKKDGTNRYAPTFGQIDPVFQIRLANTNSGADTSSLRVVAIPSQADVRIRESFNVELRVENPTQTNQTVRVMGCSWYEEWETSNTNIFLMGWNCAKNFPVDVVISPGGAYTNEAPMCIYNLIPDKELSFRMGFTPIGSKESYWSNEVKLHILPPGITKVKLKIVSVDSEETNGEDGYAANAVDGNPNTYWHTQWHGNSPGLPHEIVIELIPPSVIKGFTYLPRQDESDHGTIKDYEFYVSDDGTNFGQPVKKGTFEPGKREKIETFDPIKCRYIKIKALSEINGLPWTSAAEIGVIQIGEAARAKNYWRGNIGPIPSSHDSNKPDAIDSFVAALAANGWMWENGADAIRVTQATTPEEVVSETLQMAKFEAGMMTSYRILEIRKVHIPDPCTAVLVDTNLGQMIVLMQNGSIAGHWWRRIYSANTPYNRLY